MHLVPSLVLQAVQSHKGVEGNRKRWKWMYGCGNARIKTLCLKIRPSNGACPKISSRFTNSTWYKLGLPLLISWINDSNGYYIHAPDGSFFFFFFLSYFTNHVFTFTCHLFTHTSSRLSPYPITHCHIIYHKRSFALNTINNDKRSLELTSRVLDAYLVPSWTCTNIKEAKSSHHKRSQGSSTTSRHMSLGSDIDDATSWEFSDEVLARREYLCLP